MKIWALALCAGLLGCGGEETVASPTACDDGPVESWETFGRGFLVAYCQGCHASTAENRYDAPESVVFDTHDDALKHRDRILIRSTGANPTMPPAGGPGPLDLARLEIWIGCFEAQ